MLRTAIIIIALLVIIGSIYGFSRRYGILQPDTYEDQISEEAVEIDGDEDEIYEYDIVSRYPVEITGPVYGPETFEITTMILRLTRPHLFRDDWYEVSRREFSIWARDEYVKQYEFRREMGLAA